MLTYPEIYEILRKEKYNEKLQVLDKGFLGQVSEYLKEKNALLQREKKERPEIFTETLERTRKQMENAKNMLRELFARREKKIIDLALLASKTGISKNDTTPFLKNEKDLFERILEQLKNNEKNLTQALNGKAQVKDNNTLIRFTGQVPKFVNTFGKEIGPFNENDTANLPKKIAKTLINAKIAVPIKTS